MFRFLLLKWVIPICVYEVTQETCILSLSKILVSLLTAHNKCHNNLKNLNERNSKDMLMIIIIAGKQHSYTVEDLTRNVVDFS